MKIVILGEGLIYKVSDKIAAEVDRLTDKDALSNCDERTENDFNEYGRLYTRIENEGKFIGYVHNNMKL